MEELLNLDNIQEGLKDGTKRWLESKYGPEITQEKIDFYTEKASQFLKDSIEISKKIGIAPETLILLFKEKSLGGNE